VLVVEELVVVVGELEELLVVLVVVFNTKVPVELETVKLVEFVLVLDSLLVVGMLCPARSLTKYTPATEETTIKPSIATTITTSSEFS
jgi:hypothetical protein